MKIAVIAGNNKSKSLNRAPPTPLHRHTIHAVTDVVQSLLATEHLPATLAPHHSIGSQISQSTASHSVSLDRCPNTKTVTMIATKPRLWHSYLPGGGLAPRFYSGYCRRRCTIKPNFVHPLRAASAPWFTLAFVSVSRCRVGVTRLRICKSKRV